MRLTIILITVTTLTSRSLGQRKSSDDRLDFDFDDVEDGEKRQEATGGGREQALQDSLLRAMQKPALREQIGQVIPILRVMSPQQRLTLAALVSAQIMAPQHADQQNLAEVAHMFSGPGQTTRNVSEQLLLPISMDIAKMFRGIAGEAGRSWRSAPNSWSKDTADSRLPGLFTPETLRPDPLNSTTQKMSLWSQKLKVKTPNDINRRNGIDDIEQPPDTQDCDFLTTDMCQEVAYYPEAEILGSIQKHLTLMEPFLTDYGDVQKENLDAAKILRRRDDSNAIGPEDGYMCPSTVKYAKPKRARTTAGAWKYIVNTGDYSQTLRLEICLKAGASCSYLNDNFQSVCNQVYNYHRLMCWDEKRGLHMDVFKVPSCCSCHVQGYNSHYPPQHLPFADERKEVTPLSQSNSGVKREIPRPSFGRPDPTTLVQNIRAPGKREPLRNPIDFHIEENPKEEDLNVQQRPLQRPLFQQPGTPPKQYPSNIHVHQPIPQRQHPSLQHLNAPPSHLGPNQRPQPQYNQITIQPSQSPQYKETNQFRQPERQHGHNQQHPLVFHNNAEFQGGGGRREGLTDHLVPPGPPLPLDFDRPRPSFDQRRRNGTINRGPEYNVVMEPSSNTKRGTQNIEQNQEKPVRPSHIPVNKRHQNVLAASKSTEGQFKAPDGGFGSKIRRKPQQPAVFVTPTPIPTEETEDYDNAIRVTPKQPQKNEQKKVNYNYHPIIDFFARDAQAQAASIHRKQFQQQSLHHDSPIQYNPPQHQNNVFQSQVSPPVHQQNSLLRSPQQLSVVPSFSQPQYQKQHVPGAHEWTPMV